MMSIGSPWLLCSAELCTSCASACDRFVAGRPLVFCVFLSVRSDPFRLAPVTTLQFARPH